MDCRSFLVKLAGNGVGRRTPSQLFGVVRRSRRRSRRASPTSIASIPEIRDGGDLRIDATSSATNRITRILVGTQQRCTRQSLFGKYIKDELPHFESATSQTISILVTDRSDCQSSTMGKKRVLVGYGIDVDAVANWINTCDGSKQTPTNVSRGIYGATVGIDRLLKMYDKYGIKATWFVPGHSIESFPKQLGKVRDGGHEIGLHGVYHEAGSRWAFEAEQTDDV